MILPHGLSVVYSTKALKQYILQLIETLASQYARASFTIGGRAPNGP